MADTNASKYWRSSSRENISDILAEYPGPTGEALTNPVVNSGYEGEGHDERNDFVGTNMERHEILSDRMSSIVAWTVGNLDYGTDIRYHFRLSNSSKAFLTAKDSSQESGQMG